MRRSPGLIRRFLRAFDLPLLRKELTELAVRRRTYVVRILYAVLLLSVSWWSMSVMVGQLKGLDPEQILGSGKGMFRELLRFQAYGILLLTPAIVCSTITFEKERNTLGLLFLTRLGPWGILFEKLLSRLVPIITFLLLSLPLFAIAYSFGGVETDFMIGSIVLLFSITVQVASLSLMCSTYFRTTAVAFIWAYLLQGLLLISCGLPFVLSILASFSSLGGLAGSRGLFLRGPLLQTYLITSVFCWFWTFVFLCCARLFLFRRAFLQPKQLVLKLFKKLDHVFHDLNERYTKGIVLVHENVSLPGDEPIAWRETTKRSLGTVRYLFRVFVVIEIPLLFFCLMATIERSMSDGGGLTMGLYVAWILAALILTVQSAGLIAAERSRESLDVLLTTNLTSQEIIRQKFAGVRRATNVLRVPLLTVCLFEMVIYGGIGFTGSHSLRGFYPGLYLSCSLLAMWIYPILIGWLGVLVSMYLKSQTRAVLTTMGILLTWCCLTPFLWSLVASYANPPAKISRVVLLSSPASMIVFNESRGFVQDDDYAQGLEPQSHQAELVRLIMINFVFYGVVAFRLRATCLNLAGAKLGRNDGQRTHRQLPSQTSAPPVSQTQLAGLETDG